MVQRTPQRQSVHDQKVEEIARGYINRGWATKADLAGHSKPDTIYGYIPDVQAVLSNKWEEIVEVETPESLDTDKDQHRAFKRYANERQNTEFKIEVTD